MKITAVITAVAKSKTCPKTFCAVSINAGQFWHARVIPFVNATVNQAELFAFNYVLACIKSDIKDAEFEVTTTNQYVERMLKRDEQGQFTVKPELNVELVKQARDLIAKNPRVLIKMASADRVKALKDTIKKTLDTLNAK
jgi:hypothetical protein